MNRNQISGGSLSLRNEWGGLFLKNTQKEGR